MSTHTKGDERPLIDPRIRRQPHSTVWLGRIIKISDHCARRFDVSEEGKRINHPTKSVVLLDMIYFIVSHIVSIDCSAPASLYGGHITECLTHSMANQGNVRPHHERGVNRHRHTLAISGESQLDRVQFNVTILENEEGQESNRQNAEQRKLYIHDEYSIASEDRQINPLDDSGGISYIEDAMEDKQDSSLLSGMARDPHIVETRPTSITRHAASHSSKSAVLLGFNNVKRNRRPTNAGQNRDCSTHGGGDESHPTLSLVHEGRVGIDELIVRHRAATFTGGRSCFASDQGKRIFADMTVVSVAGASWRMEKRAHNSRLQPSHSTRSILNTTS